MASVLENLKKVLFTLFTVGYKQPSANGLVKSDGSVSCIILVASLMGFLFPVLEIFESPFSFETFFILQLSFGCLCLLSSVAWIHLLQCYRKRPHVYLDSLTSVVDPTAKIIYILLLIFTLGIFLHHGLNTIDLGYQLLPNIPRVSLSLQFYKQDIRNPVLHNSIDYFDNTDSKQISEQFKS